MQALVKGLGALSKQVYKGREKRRLGLRDGVSLVSMKASYQPLLKDPPYHCLLSLQRGSHVWV